MNTEIIKNSFITDCTNIISKEARHFAESLFIRASNAVNGPYFYDNSLEYYAENNMASLENDKKDVEKLKFFSKNDLLRSKLAQLKKEVFCKHFLYNNLSDDHSRNLLVDIAAYNSLGQIFVRLPYHKKSNIALRNVLVNEAKATSSDKNIDQIFNEIAKEASGYYDFFNLSDLGTSLKMYSSGEELFRHFFAPSYTYRSSEINISPSLGDIVLDCGACLCDTALFFAEAVGSNGKVISFEPMPQNLVVAKTNLQLNPSVGKRIFLVEAATGHKVGEQTFTDWGPASRGELKQGRPHITVAVTTIDSTVEQLDLPRVDFIKMDIEGAELDALRGGMKTIRSFKPKLAISLYHKAEDFLLIPKFIKALDLGYKFYLEHHYVNQFETVLYAIAN